MTAQFSETLHYDGQKLSLFSEPLERYFEFGGIKPYWEIDRPSTLWRGYVATWEIQAGRLYLIGLRGKLEDGTEANVATIFPGYAARVFAHWYSGELRSPQGKRLQYVHGGFLSTYESDLLITVEKGVVTKTEVRRNTVPADAPGDDGRAAVSAK